MLSQGHRIEIQKDTNAVPNFQNDLEFISCCRLKPRNNNGATRQSDGPKVTNLILNVTVSPLQTSGMMLSPLTSRDSKEGS